MNPMALAFMTSPPPLMTKVPLGLAWMGESTLKSLKITITKYNFSTFQNYIKMWTPIVMELM
jgi:hypothetical protein